MEKQTELLHPDEVELKPGNRPLTYPIYQSVKFDIDDFSAAMASMEGYFFYSRVANPTVAQLENMLAQLQGTEAGVAVGSGVASISTLLLTQLKQGDEAICFLESYRPSRLLLKWMAKFGVIAHFPSMKDRAGVERLMQSGKVKLLLLESPTNPVVCVPDLDHWLGLCKKYAVLSAIDNTFAGFHNHGQYPFDFYLHSLTKYASGHGDVMGGTILGKKALIDPIRHWTAELGPVLDPHAAYLILRGLKTYFVRYRAHCENALQVATFLASHPRAEKVLYPGLPSHPEHALARKQQTDFGAIVAFDLKEGANLLDFFKRLQIFRITGSLGSPESLAAPVALFYGGDLTDDEKRRAGIGPRTVRLSIGLEDPRDLIHDLRSALG